MKRFALFTVVLFTFTFSAFAQKIPLIDKLKEISQLPPDIPQRITAIAYDGEKLWLAVYLDKGHYATFNPKTSEWKYSDSEMHHMAIREVSQPFNSASGMFFTDNKLWLSGSYGESFGYINTETWKVEKVFKQMVRPALKKTNSQSYASMTFDGKNIWIAWHLFHYRLPNSEVQQLLKIEPETGKILEKYPLPIGNKSDGTHGLTFDGTNLWHIKDKRLSKIDSSNGKVLEIYILTELKRPSGLAWDGDSLWIVQFDGKLWSLPFK